MVDRVTRDEDEDDVVSTPQVEHVEADDEENPMVHEVGSVEQDEPEDKDRELKTTKERLNKERSKLRRTKQEIEKLSREQAETKEVLNRLLAGQTQTQQTEMLRSVEQVDQHYNQAQQNLSQMMRSGNPEAITQALAVMNDAQMRREQVRQFLQNQATQRENAPARAETQPESRATRSWKRENDWYEDPEHHEETHIASAIDSAMAADPDWGDDVGSSEYMDELTRRIKKRMPYLYGGSSEQNGARPRGKQTVAGSPMGRTGAKPKLDPRIIELAAAAGKPVDDPAYLKRLEKYAKPPQR